MNNSRPAKVESAASAPSVGPKPLCIDLFCGLGGWADGFLAEGYDVVGFDIERHDYGTGGYPGQLVLQDVLTLHGAQFRNAAVIVASPPCQFFSRMAMPFKMPWKQGEFERRRNLSLSLFNACFRIAREAGVPLVVENVKGCQPWTESAKWHYGSYYLWGDVPALMPPSSAMKNSGGSRFGQRDGKPLERNDPRDMRKGDGGSWFAVNHNASSGSNGNPVSKTGGHNHPGKSLDGRKEDGLKLPAGHDTFKLDGRPCNKLTDPRYGSDGIKQGGNWWHDPESMTRRFSSRSAARKAASAQIAKIPFPLSSHIARVFKPSVPANSNPVEDSTTRDATTPCWLLAMRDADEDAERYLNSLLPAEAGTEPSASFAGPGESA